MDLSICFTELLGQLNVIICIKCLQEGLVLITQQMHIVTFMIIIFKWVARNYYVGCQVYLDSIFLSVH
jgi:hypothetical protein